MPIPGAKKRFGPFELDSRTGELRTNGTRIKLQGSAHQRARNPAGDARRARDARDKSASGSGRPTRSSISITT